MTSRLQDKKLITAPDLDYSRCFKILLVDFEWETITDIAEAVGKLPIPSTVFLYGSNDDDVSWCLAQAKNSTGVLVNMVHRGNCETLKGFLLGESNVFSYGTHPLKDMFQRNVLDVYSWLAIQYQHYLTEEAPHGLET
jgi:hypothetical protein